MRLLAKFIAYSVKEFRVVARDPANLAILFVMPVGFVIIMSLALQDFYIQQVGAPDNSRRAQFSVLLLDGDGGAIVTAIYQQLSRLGFVEVRRLPTAEFSLASAQLREQVRSGKERFALLIPAGVSDKMAAVLAHADPAQLFDVPAERKIVLDLLIDPAVRADQRLLVSNAMMGVLQNVEVREAIARVLHAKPAEPNSGGGPIAMPSAGLPASDGLPASAGLPASDGLRASDGLLSLNAIVPTRAFDAHGSGAVSAAPTSTQQNVSAYSLLAIFMLVVPLSQTFIKERAQGSLTRLRSIGVPGLVIVGGKIPPYLVINLVQMALCLCVGRFLLPLMGGEALQFGVKSLTSIAVLTAAASLAAIGFALMVSMFARTAEQATAFGATAILLLAALGGIMVPKTVMPPWLQHYAAASPLGWAQEGFLDLFVRGAGLADIQGRAAALLAFAGVCVLLALWRFRSVGRS